MIGRINHIGIATPSIADSLKLYADLYGATDVIHIGPMPEHGVSISFLNLPNSQLEFLEPYGEDSSLSAWLAKNPAGGQHHVCFEVDDIYAARDAMRAKGATLVGTGEPRIGAHGTPVSFIHPKDGGGVLIELMQAPAADH